MNPINKVAIVSKKASNAGILICQKSRSNDTPQNSRSLEISSPRPKDDVRLLGAGGNRDMVIICVNKEQRFLNMK